MPSEMFFSEDYNIGNDEFLDYIICDENWVPSRIRTSKQQSMQFQFFGRSFLSCLGAWNRYFTFKFYAPHK